MRALAMPRSVAYAENVLRSVMHTYVAPNHTVADLREVVKNGVVVDPLKDFADWKSCARS